ncbi:hypothetical protein [Lactobacillus crispatus]|uniref:Uncharacterized protein n=1 Tax=Lactobacillus crispatus TaxID=47770 RepID=A0A7H9EAP6_9LACO|nr:hypothetical protein [Lactobacillus crispatus]QLL74676.1 hypothetical protein GTO85_10215 [Lactobacillus crispatus]
MLKNKLTYIPQKLIKQILPIKATVSNYTLLINYYDPEGHKVGSHSEIPLTQNSVIKYHELKRIINNHVPENYEIFPYFAYPQDNITSKNLPSEIMIAVRSCE